MGRKPFDKTIKRKQRKGFLWIDNQVFDDKRLGLSDKAVYVALARFVNNETQECYPSIKTLKATANLTNSTLYKSLYKLRDLGYIEIEQDKGKVNYYQLNDTMFSIKPLKNSEMSEIKQPPIQSETTTCLKENNEQYLSNNTNITKDISDIISSYKKALEERKNIVLEVNYPACISRLKTLLTRKTDKWTQEEVKRLLRWFIASKKGEEHGYSLTTALSSHTINLYRVNERKSSDLYAD